MSNKNLSRIIIGEVKKAIGKKSPTKDKLPKKKKPSVPLIFLLDEVGVFGSGKKN